MEERMKNKFKGGVLIFYVLLLTGISQLSARGFSISGGNLVDSNRNNFIIRGISHAHCWYTNNTSAIADIANVGANAARLVCSNGVRWIQTSSSELSNIIGLCYNNQLIAIPEVHDTTGYGEEGAACTLAQAASYWQNMKSVLDGKEAYVLINK
jgi:mannan endo-1,4-beta-mannosidase